MDGQANRVIKDPAQIGEGMVVAVDSTPASTSTSAATSGGGGGGTLHPLWVLLSLFWAIAVYRQSGLKVY